VLYRSRRLATDFLLVGFAETQHYLIDYLYTGKQTWIETRSDWIQPGLIMW
jgi:hypothetical protein